MYLKKKFIIFVKMIGYIITILIISTATFLVGVHVERYRSKNRTIALKEGEKLKDHLLFNRKQEYARNWEYVYRDFDIAKKVIDSAFSNDHWSTCRRYIVAFRKKYWDRFSQQESEFEDIRHEKMNWSLELYRKLDYHYLSHFSSASKLRKVEGEWKQKMKQKIRGERLDDLLGK